MELWLATTLLFFGTSFVLVVGGRGLRDETERRRTRLMVLVGLVCFGVATVHNVRMQNPNGIRWFIIAGGLLGLGVLTIRLRRKGP